MKPLRPVDEKHPMIQGWMENPKLYPKNGGHKGYDYACPKGTKDYACADGKIEFAGYRPESGYGREIVLRINERVTVVYGHHAEFKVKAGELVKAGQVIGLTGGDPYDDDPIDGYSKGAHLHFEPRVDNVPIDPAVFFEMEFDGEEEPTPDPSLKGGEQKVRVVSDWVWQRAAAGLSGKTMRKALQDEVFMTAGEVVVKDGIRWQPVMGVVWLAVDSGGKVYLEYVGES
jgi:murein DD-endopeptidase MepM/ murein hydrolase activator NlpD